jgi:uncharacterized protein YprB with RNaseH-like and TPR domain
MFKTLKVPIAFYVLLIHLKENMSKKISNVALLTFEGAAFNVPFLALLLILVYPLTMVLKQQ